MTYYIAPNGEIVEPVTYGVEVLDPESGAVLHAADDVVPIAERFTAEFVAALRVYDPEAEPNPPELEPSPEPPAPPVLQVSKRQAALALYDAGKWQAVQAALAQDPRAQLEWETSAVVDRDSPLVQALGASLGLDLDALFAAAAGK